MRPTQIVLNAAKKKSGFSIPLELTPLFLAMGVALASGTWFSYKKFFHDDSLRVGRKNPEQSGLDQVLNQKAE
ncbi:unnamed protein product [Kluyveromyces dobzhanskii CBS 2104]|uniref:WGS project CCBQ000000000 data, contig 00099 n=1 Tax=Kluyveromyces dobzhanskii CBS 2104 TaxID=1427455 RepID=A0A0A8L3X6_9SACH|nr:unnamed protein product [Kluyveromyces dobzhanskii CBS 2104]